MQQEAYVVCAVDWLLVWIDCVQFQWWPSTAPGVRLASTRGRGNVASGESKTTGYRGQERKPKQATARYLNHGARRRKGQTAMAGGGDELASRDAANSSGLHPATSSHGR
jgi:hypothetical protein